MKILNVSWGYFVVYLSTNRVLIKIKVEFDNKFWEDNMN